MIRSLIHAASAMLASAVLALSFAAAPARAATINVSGSNCTWDSPSQTLTCTSNNSVPSAPSGCTLIPTQTTLPAGGGAITLNASCSGGGVPTSYAWSGSGLQSLTASGSQSTNITQTSSFSVTPSNATGSGNRASVMVTVGGGGGGGSLANCTSQGFSVLPANPIPITWGQAASWLSPSSGAFGNDTVWLFQLTVPAGTPKSSVQGAFTIAESQGNNNVSRQLTLSTTPCDFRNIDFMGANGPQAVCSNGSTCTVVYGVDTPSFASLLSGQAALTAGTTYYISARNRSASGNSCASGNCPAIGTDQTAAP